MPPLIKIISETIQLNKQVGIYTTIPLWKDAMCKDILPEKVHFYNLEMYVKPYKKAKADCLGLSVFLFIFLIQQLESMSHTEVSPSAFTANAIVQP